MFQPNPQSLATVLSARALATLVESGVEPPAFVASSTSHGVEGGWQVTVHLTRYDGPMRFYPHTPAPSPAETPLREIEQTILEACPSEPVTQKQLAKLAGYSYSQYFRDAVDLLITRGELSRGKHGVSRPASKSATQ